VTELQADVRAVLQRLTPEHRAVLVLRDIEGYAEAQAAALLNVPAGRVKIPPTPRPRLLQRNGPNEHRLADRRSRPRASTTVIAAPLRMGKRDRFRRDFTRVVTDMRTVRVQTSHPGQITLLARGRHGLRARLTDPVHTGWCWLQSRFLVIAIAATEESPTHTRVAFTGGVRIPTAPAWTPLFAHAAAVVTDGGTLAAHASLVAREYGIPAVVATGHATRQLHTGQLVTVDGTTSTVTPLPLTPGSDDTMSNTELDAHLLLHPVTARLPRRQRPQPAVDAVPSRTWSPCSDSARSMPGHTRSAGSTP
jgi:PEP-utilising enzyme, mobile domain/Sigma-70, region 4